MTDLYLRSVEFSNFRIYGDSYAFEFPAGPGVTLITGGNGLGKTSFFDGIEWALTNDVGRFKDIPTDGRRRNIDPLTRIGAPEKSHRVSLQFSDGTVIDRGAGFEASEAEIIKLLKRPEWAEISNLHGYLSITHFFGQASAQRFSLKKPTDQWEALKGPAGVDRINTLRERMSGMGVKRAFTRAIEERGAKLEQATLDIASWNELLGERDRARQLASSENAVPPSELRTEADKVASQVIGLTNQGSWPLNSPNESPEAVLDALSSLYSSSKERAAADSDAIDSLTNLLNAFESARSESSTLGSQVEMADARLALLREDLKQADAKLLEVAEALQKGELEISHVQNRLVTIGRVAISAKQQNDALVRQAALQAEQTAAEAAQAEAAMRCEELQKRHAAAVTQRADRRALADQITFARTRSQISASLARVDAETNRITQLIADRNPHGIRERRAAWVDQAEKVAARVASLNDNLRLHDERSRSINEAVAAIAHRLSHDDTACPVCTTAFPPGRLLELVQAQLAVGATPAQTTANALAEARNEIEALNREIAGADRELAEVGQLNASLAAYLAEESDLRQQLVEAGGAADGKYDEDGVVDLEQALVRLDEALAQTATPEAIAVLLSAAEASVKAEAAKRSSAQKLLAGVADEAQTARSVLLQHPHMWSVERGILVDLAAEQEIADERARDVGERVTTVRNDLAKVQANRDALQAAEAREMGAISAANARLAALAREMQGARRRWTENGQTGEPDPNRLASYRQLVVDRLSALKPIGEAIYRLTAGYRKWLQDEQLRKLEADIAGRIQATQVETEQEYQAHLTQRVEQAANDLKLAQAAKEKVDDVGTRMQELAKEYAGGVLVPLNATIKRFARALMTWSDTAITYRAEHHATRSELRPNILRNELDGSTSQVDMNPSLYFSEGQLSALSVAALLAASTTFGWSRWRGLLLDDPLQHNDVIHASAFMDLLRQMVLGLGYQIILSTHDSAEAEFLSRKCRSAGIPHRVHELVPSGVGGLVNPYVDSSRVA
ncbi:AAA family ATPase [Xanthomonas cannabis]|uniref:AAA family ATPase n=1 Tax=Xanthomonas cannabis TaxID=1885674 RepID=UPI001E516D28|nr:AAA family ATPase [Xanthomonas cannabis]MCC8442435.1 AAA family ATPase [Xanthomonas cannabis]